LQNREILKICARRQHLLGKNPSHFASQLSLFSVKNEGWVAEVAENCSNVIEWIFNVMSQ